MEKSPITMAMILSALVTGKFKPFEKNDYDAFAGAGPDALLWCPNDNTCVVVCTDEAAHLAVEVFTELDNGEDAMWAGTLTLAQA